MLREKRTVPYFSEPENEVARKLYASFGFEEQKLPEGWDEIPAVLKLK